MAENYYSFEKGKHGGTAGYIFPFFTYLSSLVPDGEYQQYIPAGFLKCQGQILNADQYLALAEIIGVGSQCIYAREGVTLDERNPDRSGGQIQLPDLGSKYIVGAQTSGIYSNTETEINGLERAGIGVEISSNGDEVQFFYSGEFRVPSRDLTVVGGVVPISPRISTDETFLTPRNYLPHGHTSTFSTADRINTNRNGIQKAKWSGNFLCSRRGRVICDDQTNFGVQYNFVELEEAGTESGSTHKHYNLLPSVINQTASSTANESLIPAGSLVTTVKVRTKEQVKMDEFAPKYILCEYLIKY
jgi:hypothetical protein